MQLPETSPALEELLLKIFSTTERSPFRRVKLSSALSMICTSATSDRRTSPKPSTWSSRAPEISSMLSYSSPTFSSQDLLLESLT